MYAKKKKFFLFKMLTKEMGIELKPSGQILVG
jgi:hypothetical protein